MARGDKYRSTPFGVLLWELERGLEAGLPAYDTALAAVDKLKASMRRWAETNASGFNTAIILDGDKLTFERVEGRMPAGAKPETPFLLAQPLITNIP